MLSRDHKRTFSFILLFGKDPKRILGEEKNPKCYDYYKPIIIELAEASSIIHDDLLRIRSTI